MQNIAGVVIHRNFSTGSGYAYDVHINEKTVESVIELMKQKQNLPTPNSFREKLPDGRVALGDIFSDEKILDPRAVGRNPIIIRVAVIPAGLSKRDEREVRQKLINLPLPNQEGRSSTLTISLPEPVKCPEPFPKKSSFLSLVSIGLITLLILEVALTLLNIEPLMRWPLRLSIYFVMFVISWMVLAPSATQEEISACEKALLNAEPFVARDWVIPDGWYVFEGQRIDCNSAAKPRISIFPVLISEIKIASAACYPGISLVQGNDRLQLNDDRIVNYRFLRVYVRSDGRWKLLFIEWTPIVSETMAGSRVESYGWYQR